MYNYTFENHSWVSEVCSYKCVYFSYIHVWVHGSVLFASDTLQCPVNGGEFVSDSKVQCKCVCLMSTGDTA